MRGSRTVLREAAGETPAAYSPAVALVIAVEEPAFLIPVDGIVGRVEVENDALWRGCVGLEKDAHERPSLGLFVSVFLKAHATPPKRIKILDLDATNDPIHGDQEGPFFHGYYKCLCWRVGRRRVPPAASRRTVREPLNSHRSIKQTRLAFASFQCAKSCGHFRNILQEGSGLLVRNRLYFLLAQATRDLLICL